MISLFNKKSLTAAIVALSVLLMVGCSSDNANSHKSNTEDSTSSDIKPDVENDDPILQHYSILYPNGTVNTMASDPGREW